MTSIQHVQHLLPIEKLSGFPVEEIGRLVKVEGRGQEVSRPPLYLHKWWARRFGSVFRSILLGVLLDEKQDIWSEHYRAHDFSDAVILDPFMGSGTTLFEATRLGARTVGCDVNPVAWWTARAALRQPNDWSKLEEAFHRIEQEATERFAKYYRTSCPKCSISTAKVRHVRWVRILPCAHCGESITLFRSHTLGKDKGGQWDHCSQCEYVFWTRSDKTKTTCPRCQLAFDPTKGNLAGGWFTCSHCYEQSNVRDAMAKLTEPNEHVRALAILYDCADCGWGLKQPSEIDYLAHDQASHALRLMGSELAIPSAAIPTEGRSDPRPVNYGYRFWRQMFTPRQLLVLGWLASQVKDLPIEVKETFVTVVSQLTNYTNTFCVPRPNRPAAISWIFRMHAFVPPTDFLESNPLAGKSASGTFQSLFWRSVRNAYQYREQPAERVVKSGSDTSSIGVRIPGEKVCPTIVEDWEHLVGTPHSAMLLCQPSNRLPLPDQSVSHVVTDPPFFDNLTYGELAEFNYAWLREMLGEEQHEFAAPSVEHKEEVIVSRRIGKDAKFYERGLCTVFTECCRVLSNQGALVFTFHHKSRIAWETLLGALVNAGFQVSAVHPVRSESDRSLHIMNGDAIEHDAIVVCRKAKQSRFAEWDDLVNRMRQEAMLVSRKLDPAYASSKSNVATVVFGQCLKLFSEHYPHIRDSKGEVSISTAVYTAEKIAENLVKRSDVEVEHTNAEIPQAKLFN